MADIIPNESRRGFFHFRNTLLEFIHQLVSVKQSFSPPFFVCVVSGLDVDKSPPQHILDIHAELPPTLGHFLCDNTVISLR